MLAHRGRPAKPKTEDEEALDGRMLVCPVLGCDSEYRACALLASAWRRSETLYRPSLGLAIPPRPARPGAIARAA
jgi:hypothetical protein